MISGEVKSLQSLNLNNIEDRIKWQKSEQLRKYLRTHLVDMREAIRVSPGNRIIVEIILLFYIFI